MSATPKPWNSGAFPMAPGRRFLKFAKDLNIDRREDNVLSLTLRGVVPNNPDSPEGLVPTDYSSYQIFEPNDLVFKLIDLENVRTSRVGLVRERGIMSPAYVRLVPGPNLVPRFAYYWYYGLYLNNTFNHMGAGIRANLTPSDLLEVEVPHPPLGDQRRIADFLDDQTTRIDKIVNARREQSASLARMYSSELVRLVTATGPSPAQKSPWDGSPWPLVALGRIGTKLQRPVPIDSEVVTAFRDGLVAPRSMRREDSFTFSDKEQGYQGVQEGDLVFHGLDGFAGALGVSVGAGRCSPVYHVVSLPRDDSEYISLALRVAALSGLLQVEVPSTRQRAVDFRNWSTLAAVRLPRPPLAEQERIASEVRELKVRVDEARMITVRSQAAYAELKRSLISAAVSGEFDVSSADGGRVVA